MFLQQGKFLTSSNSHLVPWKYLDEKAMNFMNVDGKW